MGELKKLEASLKEFNLFINESPRINDPYHANNLANKKFSKVLTDFSAIKLISFRLQKDTYAEEINLDVKSFYIFGRIFADSVLDFCKLFLSETVGVRWNGLGYFLKDANIRLKKQPSDFQNFFNANLDQFKSLCENLRYRNFIVHEKRPNIERTITWPEHDSLDFAYLENLDNYKAELQEKWKTPPVSETLKRINSDITVILSYIRTHLWKSTAL